MELKTVGILSPGDMGHAIGHVLGQHGLRVITCLAERSERTRLLAAQAQIADVGSYAALVQEAELILSVLVPAQAQAAAQRVAQAMVDTGAAPVYADCNAVAPHTATQIADVITGAGGTFVDASIIGPPPRKPGRTRFYASGPTLAPFLALDRFGLDVVLLGEEVGRASALKMCYAALTKGFTALCTELLTAAELLNVAPALKREFQTSQAAMLERMSRGIPHMPPKAGRWVGEMEEISSTFESVGLTPHILGGAAEMYRLVAETALADRNPEDPEPVPSLDEIVATLAAHLVDQ
jgi:3-hydroxyisobutyrate dehydrogenase-like beta-hydroxyacid dehydrogenase